MLPAAFAMFAAVTLLPGPAASPRPGRPAPHARPLSAAETAVSAGDLYAARAKRRIASFLRMRLLELRLRGLDRAAAVVEHRLPLDELLRSP
jgi:hypothetical protein